MNEHARAGLGHATLSGPPLVLHRAGRRRDPLRCRSAVHRFTDPTLDPCTSPALLLAGMSWLAPRWLLMVIYEFQYDCMCLVVDDIGYCILQWWPVPVDDVDQW